MERVLVCSYDWTTGVMYKESVLRFPGKILESMHSLPGIRLGLKRALDSLQENSVAAPGGGDSNAGMQRTNNEEIVAEKETNQVVIVESGKNEVRNERPKATEGTGLN